MTELVKIFNNVLQDTEVAGGNTEPPALVRFPQGILSFLWAISRRNTQVKLYQQHSNKSREEVILIPRSLFKRRHMAMTTNNIPNSLKAVNVVEKNS